MRLFFAIIMLFSGLSCQKNQEATEIKYFDLNRLMKEQIALLKENNPEVYKKIRLGEATEEISLDSLDWDKELALFVQADINKRAYMKSYSAKEDRNGIEYLLTSGESLPVQSLTIRFDPQKAVEHIRILTATSNYLLKTQRKLELKLTNGRLVSYSIDSEQELFIGAPEKIEIRGEIRDLVK